MRYTFGNNEIAAHRIKLIADFFNPFAKRFIQENNHSKCNTAVDLGCGPGHSTEMLSVATNSENVYGLDRSDEFLQIAGNLYRHLSFINHDITEVPFPVIADIMYVRFLLSHLNNIENIITKWIKQLNPGGLLFIEELEDIYTDVQVFNIYLEINKSLISEQGADLYAGRRLAKATHKFNTIYQDSVYLPVYNRQAASWFYPNTISVWNNEKYVISELNVNERKKISDKLLEIKSDKSNESNITWKMKRIIIKNENHN